MHAFWIHVDGWWLYNYGDLRLFHSTYLSNPHISRSGPLLVISDKISDTGRIVFGNAHYQSPILSVAFGALGERWIPPLFLASSQRKLDNPIPPLVVDLVHETRHEILLLS